MRRYQEAVLQAAEDSRHLWERVQRRGHFNDGDNTRVDAA